MGVTDSVVNGVLDFFFPTPCLACRRTVATEQLFLGLCPKCSCRLRRLSAAACGCCGRPIPGASLPAGYPCGGCRLRPPAFDRLYAVWRYAPPFDDVIRGLKFGRLEYLGAQLSEELYLRLPRLTDADVVVPVPLHWLRRLRRGYNQAERIARPLAKRLGLRLESALTRPRRTPPQTFLDRRERATNLLGAFRARPRAKLRGKTVLLVDDVVTTGATLDAAATCLKRAGAETVLAVAAGIRL